MKSLAWRLSTSTKQLLALTAVAAATSPACFRHTDASKLICNDSKYCPAGYTCVIPAGNVPGSCQQLGDSGVDGVAVAEAGVDGGQALDSLVDSSPPDRDGGTELSPADRPPDLATVGDISRDLDIDKSGLFPDTASDGVADASPDVFPSEDLPSERPRDLPSPDLAVEASPDSLPDVPVSADLPGCTANGSFLGEGESQSCALTGSLGTCADGNRTCVSGNLTACSIQPSATDTCTIGNDDNCNGTPNDTSCKVLQISAGGEHTCAVLSDGLVRCWGGSTYGQLGNGSTVFSAKPVLVDGLANITVVAAGLRNTCAIAATGSLSCWGDNSGGQLGIAPGTLAIGTKPRTISPTATVPAAAVAIGTAHMCFLAKSDKSVRCWGESGFGRLGNGSAPSGIVTTPTPVADLTNVASISAGDTHTCVSLEDQTVRCWGQDNWGQMGDGGSTTPALKPVAISERGFPMASTAVTSGPGAGHTCGILSDGRARCWGRNTFGQLGDGYPEDIAPNPVPVMVADASGDYGGMVVLSGGGSHTCAVLTDGTGACWGLNTNGQLGNSSTANAATPAPISSLANIVAIAAGNAHTCAVLADGKPRCWGANAVGQVGDSSTTTRAAPVAVKNLLP